MFWPLVGSFARLAVVAVGGWVVVHAFKAPPTAFFIVIGAGFAVYALTIGGAIRLGNWAK
jgi:hypothetical protein